MSTDARAAGCLGGRMDTTSERGPSIWARRRVVGACSRWRALLIIEVILLGCTLLGPGAAAAAIPIQYQCAPAGSAECAPVAIGAWRWHAYALGYSFPPLTSWFDSEAELNTAIEGYVLPLSSWCSLNYTSTTPGGGTPIYIGGILVTDYYHPQFAATGQKTSCNLSWTYSPITYRHREVACPKGGWVLTYDTGAGVKPYCACPAGTACDPPVQYKGAICKGNPCVVTSGNKHQQEADYRAHGASPLGFTRSYNSRYAYNYRNGSSTSPPRQELVGIGWSASYLQRIDYNADGQYPGLWAHRPDGSVLAFLEQAGGTFDYLGELADRVEREFDGGGVQIGWKYTTGIDDVEHYDLAGNLLSIVSRGGVTQTLSYGSNGLPAAVTDSFGNTVQFSWSADKQLQGLTLPDQGYVAYSYDSNQNLTGVTYPDTRSRTYHYELTGSRINLLTGITDEAGSRLSTYGYATNGDVTSSQHAGGADNYLISYNGNSRTVTDPLGTARTYTGQVIRRANRYLSAPSSCAGCSESKTVTYDVEGNVATRKDFNNNETRYGYDTDRALETTRTEAYGTSLARTITTSWQPLYRLPDVITEPNRITDYDYDVNGNVISKTVTNTANGTSRTWTWTYNTNGQVLTADGPRTDVVDVTTYSYHNCSTSYQCGQLAAVTNALGHITSYNTYNAHGQPLTITDPNSVVTTLAYDARQRLSSQSIAGETTTFDYWPTGLLKRVTQPDGSYLEYTYDAAHRLTQIADDAGNHVAYTLDAIGNRTAENTYDPSNALRRTHSRVFNNLNRLWKDVNAAGTAAVTTVYGYDANGNQTTIAAPLGRNTTNAYDGLDRLTQITDPASGLTRFTYNADDALTQVTDPRNLVTAYGVNGFGEVGSVTSPDTGTTANSHDANGNLATSTDARGTVATYSYDSLNRVTAIAYGDRTISFGYDAGTNGKGRLTSASDASHALSFSYDARGRVIGKGQTIGAVTKSVGYGYSQGRLASVATPSGQTVAYGYNAAGQVTSVAVNGTTVLSNVLYEPFGGTAGWTWGNGTYAVRTYDADGKITQVDSGGLKTYAYDDAFRITGITDTVTPANSWTYGYDSLDRLTGGVSSGTTRGWSYDANGNRLTETGTAPSTYTVSSSNNRITAISGNLPRTYAYDAVGNTTGYAGVAFSYDNRGRMTSASYGGNSATYVYNALGQRIRRVGPSGTTLYMYDESGHLLGEYDGSGALVQETVWLGDTPVATLRPNGSSVDVFYVHTDHLNTPRLVTQPSGNAERWRWDSDPFGTNAANENPSGLGAFKYTLRFPGQQYDGLAGLYYNYFRDYDPAVGRYVESDPIGLHGGVNTYDYAAQDPLQNIDPTGTTGIAIPASPGLTLPDWLVLPGIRALGIVGAALSLSGDTSQKCDTPCPPCKTVSGRAVPVGTIAYRPLDTPPPGTTQHGIAGPHFNLYKANQAPRQSPQPCKCFWQPVGAVPGNALPPGAIPIEPFAD